MAQKTRIKSIAGIDYSNLNIFTEEAKNIENHKPSMVTSVLLSAAEKIFSKAENATSLKDHVFRSLVEVKIRIIPSKLWTDDVLAFVGNLTHESLHILLLTNFGSDVCLETFAKLDNLPKAQNPEDYLSGVWGWNLNHYPWKCHLRRGEPN